MSGTICTCVAVDGKAGSARLASCVEYMIVPLGHVMLTGLVVGRILITGALQVAKWLVQPVSAMLGGGGSFACGIKGGPSSALLLIHAI
jgi:hypothetical protein